MTRFANKRPGGSLDQDVMWFVTEQTRRFPFLIILILAVVMALAIGHAPIWMWAGWFALECVAVAARRPAYLWILNNSKLTPAQKIKRAGFVNMANTSVHALALGFFPFIPELNRALISIIFVSIATGAVGVTAGHRRLYLSYILPMMLTLVVAWALHPGSTETGWISWAFAVLLLIFTGLQARLAADAYGLFRESYDARAALADALGQAEIANSAKTRFLASASHDLRQPIHTLSLFSVALGMQKLDDKTRQIACHMDTALEGLAYQLDALLDISKLDAGVVQVDMQPVDMARLVHRLFNEHEPLCEEKGIALELDCVEQAPVLTDIALLERILRNLISNAVKYTDEGTVSIRIRPEARHFCITVADTGRGIPPEEQSRIFEEFYQLQNPERDRKKGLGLGLAIVKRLAKMLEIDVAIESTAGVGTHFNLRLEKHSAQAQPSVPTAAANPAYAAENMRLRVLVVDDEQAVRLGMETVLDAMGFTVMLADGTAQALAQARATPPDIVLADMRLRGDDDGLATVRTLRELTPALPAILISGDIAPERLQLAREAGLDILHKPVSGELIRTSILNACGMA